MSLWFKPQKAHFRRRSHWLVRLYPRAWRERYGEELDQILRERRPGLRDMLDIARAAVGEHLFNPSGLGERTMPSYRGSVIAMVKHPSGWVPLVLSLVAVLMLVAALGLTVQVAPDAPGGELHDEGPLARLYQLIMLVEVVLIGWFSIRWARHDLKAGATVIALQVLAIMASFVPLLIIEW